MNKKLPEIEPLSQEFTLPFVGREEELQFLLNEYDQMLHAQHRSVWIEAPAGMGKTTLVEEFLRRIKSEPLKPWIVHTNLRERSSNSLASLVDAVGSSLQTLSEKQQEKLFSGLTSFYHERAKKIVGGGSQTLAMEEALMTAGYILKKLSYHFPLIIIIEDLHVLKGETSFYALRQLLAILEHIPTLVLFISRPSDEKDITNFRTLFQRDGARKFVLEGLKENDVQKLLSDSFRGDPVPELMKLCGGNALLLREILRASIKNSKIIIEKRKLGPSAKAATSEAIIYYLTEELHRLPKKDRQVAVIAGMLGQEFSEELLQSIAESEHFKCWSVGVLQRLEHQGIIRRERKMLSSEEKPEEQSSFLVSVFTHALWWEAARGLYREEKKRARWVDKKFAEIILPLLSKQAYPLVTDAELIVNLFRWLPRKKSINLLRYVDGLNGSESHWHFHSYEESAHIFLEVLKYIMEFLEKKWFPIDKQLMWVLVRLIDEAGFAIPFSSDRRIQKDTNQIMLELFSKFIDDEEILANALKVCLIHGPYQYLLSLNTNLLKWTYQYLKQIEKIVPHNSKNERMVKAASIAMNGIRMYYDHPTKAAYFFLKAFRNLSWDNVEEQNLVIGLINLSTQSTFFTSQDSLREYISVVRALSKATRKSNSDPYYLRYTHQICIEFCLLAGQITEAHELKKNLDTITHTPLSSLERTLAIRAIIALYSYEGDYSRARPLLDEYFSGLFPGANNNRRFKVTARFLLYLDENKRFEKLWEENYSQLLLDMVPAAYLVYESRVFFSLLEGKDREAEEALLKIKEVAKSYPILNGTIRASLKKINLFIELQRKKKSIKIIKESFQKYLHTDETLSPFDKAFFAQLFARIGVRYGHRLKDFSSYVKFSLEEFEKLKIPQRIILTAKKFAEVNLLSKEELEKIIRTHEPKTKQTKQEDTPKEKIGAVAITDVHPSSGEAGITLYCMGRFRAVDPRGNEIIGRRWGKRKNTPSHQKILVMELIRAWLEQREVTRKELMAALYPKMRSDSVSRKTFVKYDWMLSIRLSEVKKSFAPYLLFEKTREGYSLHPSVRVDILQAKASLRSAKLVAEQHLPSAQWLLLTMKNIIDQGEFVKELRSKQVTELRKDISRMNQEGQALLRTLEKRAAL